MDIKSGDYVVYKWSHGRITDPYYLNLVHVEDVISKYQFSGWWENERLNSDLHIKNVIYIGKSESDARNYIKDHTDSVGRLVEADMSEGTIQKKNGKWTNKGKKGEHGEFSSKKKADAQRKAMFANGYKG